MSPRPPLLLHPVVDTRRTAITRPHLPSTESLTLSEWIPFNTLGHTPKIVFGPITPPASMLTDSTTPIQQAFSAIILAAIDFSAMIDMPTWTATAFSLTGLSLLVLGMIAWLGSHSEYRRAWGQRLALSGGGLFVIGTAFDTFVNLLQYVLG